MMTIMVRETRKTYLSSPPTRATSSWVWCLLPCPPGKSGCGAWSLGCGLTRKESYPRIVASGAMGQILLFVGLFETLAGIPACVATMNGDREPGDFEFGGIFKPTDPVQLRRKQNAEPKNGRPAMPAFSGQVTQAVLTGHDAPFLY